MKKLITLTKTLLVVALLGVGVNGVSASETVTFTNRYYMTVVTGADGTLTATGGANNKKYSLATADLTGVTGISTAGIVQIEFDCTVTSGGRWIIGIGDVTTRGTNANGSSVSSYNTTGLVSFFGTNNGNNLRINSWSGTRNDNLFGKDLHVTFVLNRIEKTYTCNIVDKDDNTQKLSASGATTVDNATVVEAYTWYDKTEKMSDVTVTITPAYSYTVNAVDGSSKKLATIAQGTYFVGDDAIRVDYPQNILVGNTLYSIPMRGTNPRFAQTITPDKDNYTVNLTYSNSTVSNVIRYFEAENISGVSKGSNTSYASLNNMGYTSNNTTYKEVMTLPAGKYTIYARGVNGNSAARTCNFKVGEGNPVWTFSITGSNTDVTGNSTEFTVAEPSTLYFACDGSSASGCDWFYIKGMIDEGADVTGMIVNPDMETSAGGSEYWQEGVKGWNNCSVVTNYRQLAYSADNNLSGAFKGTNAFENWTDIEGGLVGQMSQTINSIPNGIYKFQLAAMVNNVNGQFIYGKSNGKTYKTYLAGDNNQANDYSIIVVVEDNQLEIGLDMNNSGATWAAIDEAKLTYTPADAAVTATLGTNGYATFASPYALDLTKTNLPEGLTAYKASVSGTTVTFTELNQTVPANTGVLLQGETSGSYNIPVVASGTEVTENSFLVNEDGTTFTGDDNYYYFGLKKNTLTFGTFDPSTVAIPASKAYLKVLKSSVTNGARLNVRFADDEVAGISQIENGKLIIKDSIYNLSGQRVTTPTKGLYIVNGKKVIK